MSEAGKGVAPDPAAERQRLDKWLWFARVVKSRSLAARLVADGHVRVDTVRADNPAKSVKVGDILTISLDRDVRVLRILGPGVRRGPYPEARLLFDDLTAADGSSQTDGDET